MDSPPVRVPGFPQSSLWFLTLTLPSAHLRPCSLRGKPEPVRPGCKSQEKHLDSGHCFCIPFVDLREALHDLSSFQSPSDLHAEVRRHLTGSSDMGSSMAHSRGGPLSGPLNCGVLVPTFSSSADLWLCSLHQTPVSHTGCRGHPIL